MADDVLFLPSKSLIAERFVVDADQVWLDAAGGLTAYHAHDRQARHLKRVAVSVSRDASPRARPLKLLTDPIDNLMVPLAHGVAPMGSEKGEGYFVICTPPPGPSLAALNVWPEKAVTDLVLRPIARVLDVLESRGLTHRGIRPNNVFQAAPGQPVVLGQAWAAPPAMHQPAVFESPYSGMCHPAGRGDGTIADDVYALGVLLLTLLAGRVPLANLDDKSVVRWKLDLGSFASLTRDVAVSGSFGDLLRGMLAEDPDHRPSPAQLLDPNAGRTRRVVARPPRRSQRPLTLNDIAVFDARTLSYALALDEKRAIQFLRNGLITQWLRRDLGDAGLAAQIEELVRARSLDTRSDQRGDSMLVMHVVAAINPRMPLCWRGVHLWPDSLPALLAEGIASESDLKGVVEEVIAHDVREKWAGAETRSARSDVFSANPEMLEERHSLHSGAAAGLLRLFYKVNPLLPCRLPAMAKEWIADMPALMQSVERTAVNDAQTVIDLHMAAFIAARAERAIEVQIYRLVGVKGAAEQRTAELVILRDLQLRYRPSPMPHLAAWCAMQLRPNLERWRNVSRREAILRRLEGLAQAGLLRPLLELVDDPTARVLDMAGAHQAAAQLAAIESELVAIDSQDSVRFRDAERLGQAITGGIGLSVVILTVMSVLLK